MPWKETCPMDERLKFVSECLDEEANISDLCRIYRISRKTGYKWLNRYKECGASGLVELSRAPHHCQNAVSEDDEEFIVQFKGKHMKRGPAKVKTLLEREFPGHNWPAVSTIGEILKRRGLVIPRKRSRKSEPYSEPFADVKKPNELWCADFKGWFRTGDKRACYPLTMSDAETRYLIKCQGLRRTRYEDTKPLFEAAFMEYGLPLAIRTDNGPPFASTGLAGLSHLSVWFIRLGIKPERIKPGRPDQNGRHERMHRTLKFEAASPPERDLRSQQEAFDAFREEYNNVRPHEALDMMTPGDFYTKSDRPYPMRAPEMEYPEGLTIRRVRHNGEIKWKSSKLYLTEALVGELIGLEDIDDRYCAVRFGAFEIAWIDNYKIRVLSHKEKEALKRRMNKKK